MHTHTERNVLVPNANVRRGKDTEREAAKLLSQLLGLETKRLATEGIREDIGDLRVPDTCVQVTRTKASAADITVRVRAKLKAMETQRRHLGATYGVVLLRIDGSGWRAVLDGEQFSHLVGGPPIVVPSKVSVPGSVTLGEAVRWGPLFARCSWSRCQDEPPVYASTVETWAEYWKVRTGR